VLAWLLGAAVGPATVTLPIGWTADVLADVARRWFRRFGQINDLCRLVHLATGTSVDLTRDELDAVRRLLAERQTWVKLGNGPVEDLATWIADFLPPRDGRTADDSHAAALVITRGLLEFTAAELEPKTFQKMLLARLMRMETGQASTLDQALFDFHSDLVARLDPDWVGQLQALRYPADAGPRAPRWLDRQPEGSEDVISQVAWRPSRKLPLRVATPVVAGLSMAALLLLAFTVAGMGGARSASAASLRIVKIGSVSVLANGQGFTVYWFVADTATKSECNGLCTAYWPPVKGPLTAGTCLTRRLGTIARSDGVTQATYDGHPLYTYIGDSSPGQARGGAPSMNGGPWREITYPANPCLDRPTAGQAELVRCRPGNPDRAMTSLITTPASGATPAST
jgi:predicted lipoprotein with Yx(FWY)xxD motif